MIHLKQEKGIFQLVVGIESCEYRSNGRIIVNPNHPQLFVIIGCGSIQDGGPVFTAILVVPEIGRHAV
jgi:hypothetical protein